MGSVHSPAVKSAVDVGGSTSCNIPQSLESVICYISSLVFTSQEKSFEHPCLIASFSHDTSSFRWGGLGGLASGKGPGLESDEGPSLEGGNYLEDDDNFDALFFARFQYFHRFRRLTKIAVERFCQEYFSSTKFC